MNRPKAVNIVADAFFDNFSCAALFGRLRIPGSPREIVDPRSLKDFSSDELRYGLEDIRKETKRIVNPVVAEEKGPISTEYMRGLFDGWMQKERGSIVDAANLRPKCLFPWEDSSEDMEYRAGFLHGFSESSHRPPKKARHS